MLTSSETKSRLARRMGEHFYQELLQDGLAPAEAEARTQRSRVRIESAPAAVLLCLDSGEVDMVPGEGRQSLETHMAIQSVALAGATLLLAAHAEGLGGVWLCAPLFAVEIVLETLHLPGTWQPQALLLLGYPPQNGSAKGPPNGSASSARTRRPMQEVTLFLDDPGENC